VGGSQLVGATAETVFCERDQSALHESSSRNSDGDRDAASSSSESTRNGVCAGTPTKIRVLPSKVVPTWTSVRSPTPSYRVPGST